MSKNWSGLFTFGIIIIIIAISFFVWVLGLILMWLILRFVGFPTDLWQMIEALSSAVTAAAVLSAGFIAYRELSEVASSRHVEVADRLFNELNSPANIDARRWVYQHLPKDPEEGIKSITPEGQLSIKQVLNSLDHVAFLTQSGWIPEDIIMPWMHPMIVKSWEKLEPYVNFERTRRDEPYYYQKVSELAYRCHSWRVKNLGETTVKWVDDAL